MISEELSQPVDMDNERAVLLLGNNSDQPEREQCRLNMRPGCARCPATTR
ncbi:hypothetical protein [Micromonospora sp. CB01531]|nr:hypothetical protein [Micromonospora sp. CB01531]